MVFACSCIAVYGSIIVYLYVDITAYSDGIPVCGITVCSVVLL